MSHQHATIGDTVYFWFASNDTSGSGGDGATPLFDVREAGAAAGAAPLLSGTPTLLSHVDFPAGCHEIAVAATTGNGFAADDTFAVFCTLAIDSQNPTGFVGSCTLTPLAKESQLDGLANVGSAIHRPAASYTLTTGTQSSGTYTDTEALDGTNHEHTDTAGVMELYYEFLIGSGTPSSCQVSGYVTGPNDDLDVFGYDWATTSWKQIGNIQGSSSTTNSVYSFDMFVDMVGSGADEGKVRVRFYKASGLTSATLAVDQIFIAYSQGQEGYEGGAIWVDTNASNTGTTRGIDGVATNPVSTWAAALTLSTSTGLTRFQIASGSTITLSGNSDSYTLTGHSWTLALNGQSIVGIYVEGASVSGIASGTGTSQYFVSCLMGACTHIKGTHFNTCGIFGTQTVGEAGDYFYDRCHSSIAGTGTWTFDFGAAIGNTNLNWRNGSGGIQLESMGDTGTDTASIEGRGQVIEGTCTGGTVALRGNYTDTGFQNLTLSDGARFHTEDLKFIADIIESQRGAHTWQGNVWYVDPVNGNDTTGNGSRSEPYATVTKAHTSATDNNHDVIFLVAGNTGGQTTLTEQVTISKNYLFIRGPGRDFYWDYNANGDVITVTGVGVELSGFVVQTHTAGSGDAINISGDFCRVHNVWVEYARQYGIYIENADWCQIHDNTIFNTGKDAASAGIYVFQSGVGTALHNKIFDNAIEDNTGAAIEVAGGTEDVVIKHNNIHGSSTWGVLIGAGAVTTGVYANVFSDNTSGDLSDSGTDTYTQNNEQWAIDGAVLTSAERNQIADHTIRRSFANAAASSDGDTKSFRSLLGAIAKLVNKISVSGSSLTITEEDDSTALGTQTLTTDSNAQPIVSADTD
jgi:hypothetical protein